MTATFVKHREPARPGSIPDRLQMFTREVRFYTEVAPSVGVRVPTAFRAEVRDGSTVLELEDLSSWRAGADPVAAARALASLHERWVGQAEASWPWLPRPDASDLVGALYEERWPVLRGRSDVTDAVRRIGDALVGEVSAVERVAHTAGHNTLTHGDASAPNLRTGPDGEVALLDWEDVGSGPGICDVAWFLMSSVEPADWDRVLDAYGDASGLGEALPAISVQALLSLDGEEEGSVDALEWIGCLEEATGRL
ncbi:phosphotransferase family protein [Nocardioides sp. Soil805]|uniref:phosphotransferase family protein n=1 Tax=Nocardioides sp. Soil805 TaxID=1736416 RepID=UPI00138F7ABB|nr:aminoglycoside phosphotransferase family protein [Nocardioides sp. Soil805]